MATNPTDRFTEIFSGIEFGSYNANDGGSTGTIGCFISTTGLGNQIPAGNYLLSCFHVLCPNPNKNDYDVYQPSVYSSSGETIPGNLIGRYIYGIKDVTHDCAIAQLNNSRTYVNKIPTAPFHPGKNRLAGIAQGNVNDEVYKFGAYTKYTTGTITAVNGNQYTVVNNSGWAGGGDSGSVLVRKSDNMVLGLNYAVAGDYIDGTGVSRTGHAYSIFSQLLVFVSHGGTVNLI